MDQKIYIISDTELGRKDKMDDFTDDEALADFIDKLTAQNPGIPATLVLNGDTFDFLKMGYKDKYPRLITEEISVWKMKEVFTHHPKIFDSMKGFLTDSNHHIVFVIGNHDADLIWPSLQEMLKERLGNNGNIEFTYIYRTNGLHIEHGHLIDPFYEFNTKKAILKYRGKKVLNMPWANRAYFNHLVKIKEHYPMEERIHPVTEYMHSFPELRKFTRKVVKDLVIKDVLMNPLIHFYDPTYSFPFIKATKSIMVRGWKAPSYDKLIRHDLNKIAKRTGEFRLNIFGHKHILFSQRHKDKLILITDTWRNEIDAATMNRKEKSYAEVLYESGNLTDAALKIHK